MDFKVKDQLTNEEVDRGLTNIIRENLAFQVMATLTGGVFLVAFANELHASNFVIGLLAAVGPLAQLIQIPAIYLVERIQNRRLIVVSATLVARLMWLLIALIPFLVPGKTGLFVLLGGMALYSGFAAISNCSWSSWMRDLVPQDRMGAFFSRRMVLAAVLGMGLGLIAGFYIDQWKRLFPGAPLLGYSIMFFVGGLAGLLGVYLFTARIPEPRMVASGGKMTHLLAMPFRERNFRNLIIFEGSWNFAVNLAAPFFTVYMLQWLGFDLTSIVILSTISQITNILVLRTWGRLVDRFSNKSVLSVSATIFILCIFGWTFTTLPDRYFLTVPLLIVIHLATGMSTAGVALASGNMGLKLAPRGQATAYLAARSLVNSLAASTAPIIGGSFADYFKGRQLSISLNWNSPLNSVSVETLDFQHWDFFFFFAFLVGLFALYRLRIVQESGDVTGGTVIHEFVVEVRHGLRSLSSIQGVSQAVSQPLGHHRRSASRRKAASGLPGVPSRKLTLRRVRIGGPTGRG